MSMSRRAAISEDGRYRISVTVAWRFELWEIAEILASSRREVASDDLPRLTVRGALDDITMELRYRGRGHGLRSWRDDVDAMRTKEERETLWRWANEQATRLFGRRFPKTLLTVLGEPDELEGHE